MADTGATTSIANWSFNQYHVQAELKGGDFISSESTLVAAGPPELADIGLTSFEDTENGGEGNGEVDGAAGEPVYPMGVLESFGITQARQTQKLFEIGSSRAYYIPGKTMGSISVARALYNGPSLLKILYAYYRQKNGNLPLINSDPIGQPGANGLLSPNAALLTGDYQADLVAIKTNPGYGNMWLNIASELFNQPTGLMLYMRNAMDVDFGAVYLEQVYVTGHQMSLNAGVNVIMESCSMEFEHMQPVEVNIAPYKKSMEVT